MDSSAASIAIPLIVAIVAALLVFGAIALLLRRQQPEILEEAAGLKLLRSYKWRELAQLLLQSLRRRGYEPAESERAPSDGGSDLLVQRGSDRYLVQCKQGAHTVGAADVRNLLALMPTLDATGAILVTAGRFDADAQQAAKGRPVQLLDGFSFWREVKAILPAATLDQVEREIAARQRLFTTIKGAGAALAAAVTYVAVTVWMRPPADLVPGRVAATPQSATAPKTASVPPASAPAPSTASVSPSKPAATPTPPAAASTQPMPPPPTSLPVPAQPSVPAPAAASAPQSTAAVTPATTTAAAPAPLSSPRATSTPATTPAATPATAPAPATVKAPAPLLELTEAQELERRKEVLGAVRAVVGVESTDWSTKSTLAVALRAGNEERVNSLVAEVCSAVVAFEELRYTRLQVTDSLATSEADKRVRWRQCQ